MKLSNNFSLQEFVSSETALRRGIINSPGAIEIESLRNLAEFVLQPLRDGLGISIHITSGYRSPALNKVVKGSKTSQHLKGEAADFVVPKNIFRSAFDFIKNNLDFDQLIWEYGNDNAPDWIHVSFSIGKNRNEVLRAYTTSQGPVYKKFS